MLKGDGSDSSGSSSWQFTYFQVHFVSLFPKNVDNQLSCCRILGLFEGAEFAFGGGAG